MDRRQVLIAAALAGLAAAPAASVATAADKEKCYGIAQVGKNDCADAAGLHSCAGQYKQGTDPKPQWKYVAKGTCVSKEGGTTTYVKK